MNFSNFTITVRTPNGHKTFTFSPGKPFPISIPVGSVGGALGSLGDGAMMLLSLFVHNPSKTDRRSFQENLRFALYQGPDMPGGLILIGLPGRAGSGDLILECPFSVAEAQHQSGSLDAFFTSSVIPLYAVLSDSASTAATIKEVRKSPMPPSLVDALRITWRRQAEEFSGDQYYAQYKKLIARKGISQLWSEATKF